MTAKLIWINDLIGELRMLFETTGALFGKCRSRPPSYLGRLGQAMARRHLVARASWSATLRLGRSVRLAVPYAWAVPSARRKRYSRLPNDLEIKERRDTIFRVRRGIFISSGGLRTDSSVLIRSFTKHVVDSIINKRLH